MRRDTLKTFGAIVLILIIVGVTFWYGNRQRQAQVKKDQLAAEVQTKKSSTSATEGTKSPAKSVAPAPASPSKTTPAPVSPTVVTPAPTATPQTGGELAFAIPLGAIVLGYQLKKASERSLKRSLLSIASSPSV